MWTNKNKIFYIFYTLTAKWLPESSHLKIAKKFRYFWLKKIIMYAGINVNVEHGAKFTPELRIGNNSGVGINCEMCGPITIGDNVMMGPEVVIYTRNHKHSKGTPFLQQGYEIVKPVFIEDNVWIGRRVMIMPGCKIGKNTVIAAGSIVCDSFEDGVIIGGVPAKVLKKIQ